jgi:hypothetical protein
MKALKQMNFIGGKAEFWATHAGQVCFPCGVTTIQHDGPNRNIRPKPEVVFVEHRYDTKNLEIAAGLVNDETNFGRSWGWFLQQGCLPETLREFYLALPLEVQRDVALRLIAGESDEKVFDSIDADAMSKAKATAAKPASGGEYILTCPKSGCNVSIGGEGVEVQEAQKLMSTHVRTMHADK